MPWTGSAPDFLGTRIEAPRLAPGIADDAVRWQGSEIIPYTRFSLALSSTRRFARWVAWNIDGADLKLPSRSNLEFSKDPRLPSDTQTGNGLYAGNRLACGHNARRADLLWGPRGGVAGQRGRVLLQQHHPADGRLQPEQPAGCLGSTGEFPLCGCRGGKVQGQITLAELGDRTLLRFPGPCTMPAP